MGWLGQMAEAIGPGLDGILRIVTGIGVWLCRQLLQLRSQRLDSIEIPSLGIIGPADQPLRRSRKGGIMASFAVALLLLLGSPVASPPAWADPAGPTVAAPIPRPPLDFDSATIPAETLSRFVRAYLDVFKLIEQREGDLQSAETETLSLRIRQEIETEAYRLIEATGMSRQEYIQILSLANIDPELGEQIAAQLQESGTEMP
jgi:hypothetical protein